MAISLHQQSTIDNAALAKRRAKCKHRLPWRMKGENSIVKVVGDVTPNEVIDDLRAQGIVMCRKTLTRWEQAGLIPIPERGGRGQGLGSYTDYPPETVEQAATVYSLKNQYSYERKDKLLAKARQMLLHSERNITVKNYLEVLTMWEYAKKLENAKAFSVDVVLDGGKWVPKVSVHTTAEEVVQELDKVVESWNRQ